MTRLLVLLLLTGCSSAAIEEIHEFIHQGAVAPAPTDSQTVRANCNVSYTTQQGVSLEFPREVIFVRGAYLNEHIGYQYSPYSVYVLLWFGPGEVAIAESQRSIALPSPTFTMNDFATLYQFNRQLVFNQVNGTTPRQWIVRCR